jgi:endonuclease G
MTLNLLTTLTPSEVAAHPLLTHIAPYGLPALPFVPAPSQIDGSAAVAPFHLSPPLFLRHAFLSAYNTQRRTADWCLERLVPNGREQALEIASSSQLSSGSSRDSCSFASDPLISSVFQPAPSTYRHSGFDRGHLVPAADVGSGGDQEAMCETFVLSNIAPQVPQFNRGYWLQLEHHVRKLAERHGEVFVVTGPMWIPQQQAEGGKANGDDATSPPSHLHTPVLGSYPFSFVHVPSHFYKIVLVPNKNGAAATSQQQPLVAAFIIPNAPLPLTRPLTDFSVPLLQVELGTGWRFFPKVNTTRRDLCDVKGACEMKVKEFHFRNSSSSSSSK